MLTLLSPAKTLDFGFSSDDMPTSVPRLQADVQVLLDRCRELNVESLRSLMSLSQPLAELNQARFQAMSLPLTSENSKPCALAFGGDVYRGFDARSLSVEELSWAQERLRILSGFYGVLRPMDLIQPYRLEMGTKLDTERGKNLYEFWGNRITDVLNEELRAQSGPTVLNLASNEYFRSVRPERLEGQLVTALFQEVRNGKPRTISFSAKRARGLMARFMVINRVDDPEGLKDFAEEGYTYRPEMSVPDRLLFVREQDWSA